MQNQTGGPAFPRFDIMENIPGMTLLDYFAGQICAAHIQALRGPFSADPEFRGLISRYSYEMASALVAEKARRETAAVPDYDRESSHTPT